MSLTRALLIGGAAALGLPTLLRTMQGDVGEFLRRGAVHLDFMGFPLRWHWTVFATVTLFSFLVILATRNR